MDHRDIWRGLDGLAAFNPSKRTSRDGRPRWPSTESVAAALAAVGDGFDDLAGLIDGRRGASVPLIGFAEAGRDGFFDEAGFPSGSGWDEVRFPGLGEEAVYALEVSGDSMQPAFRSGDRIIVSPGASLRRGDRVVARTRVGEVMAKELGRRSEKRVELLSLNPDFAPLEFTPAEIAWLARILWVSQ